MASEDSTPPAPQEQVVWEPQLRQAAFLTCPCSDVAFGGARGGGKSDAVLGDWLSHEETYGTDGIGIVIRRERTQLIELIERARVIFTPLGYSYKDVDKVFTGPKGGRLRFTYLERDSDAEAFQGHSYSRLYVEEMATFPSESPINKLQATLRSGAGVPCQMKCTMNPGGSGHGWVKARYRLDEFPEGGEVFRFSFTNPYTKKTVERTRVFIPSRVFDNKYLDDDYIANLYQVGSENLVRAWLQGDWSVIEGAFFSEWSSKNIVTPFAVPQDWTRFRSVDWGAAKPFSVGWWAVAGDDYTLADGRMLPRGSLIRYREWYGASSPNVGLKLTVEEVALGIISRSGDEAYAYTVVDPSMFAQSGGPSLAERMSKAGLSDLRRGDNRRVAQRGFMGGWDMLRHRIRGDGETPMLFVFSTCTAFLRTVPALQHDSDRPEDLDTSAEDHVGDETRYAVMSRPWIARPIERKPSDHMVLMAGSDGRVNYYRPDDDGKPEIVDVKEVVRRHCERKERERRRDLW
jgi:Phage terminase large subunit